MCINTIKIQLTLPIIWINKSNTVYYGRDLFFSINIEKYRIFNLKNNIPFL